MSSTDSEVIEAAEALGETLAAEKEDLGRMEFSGLVTRCNQAIEQEIGVDYGSICSDDDCC